MSDEAHGHGGGGHGGGHGPAGGGGHEEGHEGAPEWLISFADNVALMMGFFVVLLAMNMKPSSPGGAGGKDAHGEHESSSEELLDFAIGLRDAFNNPINPDDPKDAVLYRRLLERRAAEAVDAGQRGQEREVKSIRPSDYYGMGGTVAFETGSAELHGAGQAALEDLLKHRRGLRNIIQVRGHASAAEAYERADRGMSLSYERAMTVAQAMVASGIGWTQIQIVACADSDRVAPKTYDQLGHRANQRVEIIETDRAMQDDGDAGAADTPQASASAP